jgi:FkbM family methyltransferase
MDEPLKPGDIGHYLAHMAPAERELKRLFRRGERLVIFDVGACEGEESIRYALAFPRARIFAFEPLPSNQRLVRENFDRYHITSAELIDVALSDHDGTAQFHVSSGKPPEAFAGEDWNYGNKSSSLLPPAAQDPLFGWVEFNQKITVKTQTLDGFATSRGIDHIDFVHMDVQGAEYLVLAGASQMLRRTTAVWLEVAEKEIYRGQHVRTQIEQEMAAAGFAKTLELSRGVEGDQFYVNRRCIRIWPYLLARRAVAAWRRRRLAQP